MRSQWPGCVLPAEEVTALWMFTLSAGCFSSFRSIPGHGAPLFALPAERCSNLTSLHEYSLHLFCFLIFPYIQFLLTQIISSCTRILRGCLPPVALNLFFHSQNVIQIRLRFLHKYRSTLLKAALYCEFSILS